MPVETAADIASLFQEEEFAEAAAYLSPAPGADPAPCIVIVDRGQGRESFNSGKTGATGSERNLTVRASELAEVERNGLFSMLDDLGVATGETFRVVGLPRLDQTGKLWSVELAIVD